MAKNKAVKLKTKLNMPDWTALTESQQKRLQERYETSFMHTLETTVDDLAQDEAEKIVNSPKFRASVKVKLREAMEDKLDEVVHDAINDMHIELA